MPSHKFTSQVLESCDVLLVAALDLAQDWTNVSMITLVGRTILIKSGPAHEGIVYPGPLHLKNEMCLLINFITPRKM